MDVLEAIHLLLSFRLFIVVVAVDPRWVLESLRYRYPHLSENYATGTGADSALQINDTVPVSYTAANAHDYLEKIFHIPFWVKPMGPHACKDLISGYLGLSEADLDETEKERSRDADRFHDLVQEASARVSSVTERAAIKAIDTASTRTIDQKAVVEMVTPSFSEETMNRLQQEREAAEGKIENVDINREEWMFIRKLAPHLGNSPRRIKRYANTYRLLKSGLTGKETVMFDGGESSNDDYQIVLVFLAIATGAPSIAPQIFSKAFDLRNDFNTETLIDEANLNINTTEASEAKNARKALELLDRSNVTQKKIETWVPRVMRYAFRFTPIDVRAKST